MKYVKIKVIEKGTAEDLQHWKDHMLEEPKCWNKFCLDCYGEEELYAVHVIKEDNAAIKYITTLCDDCFRLNSNHDILVNDNHLMVKTNKN